MTRRALILALFLRGPMMQGTCHCTYAALAKPAKKHKSDAPAKKRKETNSNESGDEDAVHDEIWAGVGGWSEDEVESGDMELERVSHGEDEGDEEVQEDEEDEGIDKDEEDDENGEGELEDSNEEESVESASNESDDENEDSDDEVASSSEDEDERAARKGRHSDTIDRAYAFR